MKITRDPAAFRPVTIRLESEDEVDKLAAIVNAVARNRINHTPQLVAAAKHLDVWFRRRRLLNEEEEDI